MKVNLFLVCIIWILNITCGYCREIKKRQLYREQVLPHAGGKIPDSAFETDRLALNQLQKEGIAVPDGVFLEQRNPQVFPKTSKDSRPVYRVSIISNNRYTAREGKYSQPEQNTIDTTYTIPIPTHGCGICYNYKKPVVKPTYKKLIFTKVHPNDYLLMKQYIPPYTKTYPNSYELSRWPLTTQFPYDWNLLQNDYVAANIFNDFEAFFGQVAPNYKTYSNPIYHPAVRTI